MLANAIFFAAGSIFSKMDCVSSATLRKRIALHWYERQALDAREMKLLSHSFLSVDLYADSYTLQYRSGVAQSWHIPFYFTSPQI